MGGQWVYSIPFYFIPSGIPEVLLMGVAGYFAYNYTRDMGTITNLAATAGAVGATGAVYKNAVHGGVGRFGFGLFGFGA